MYVFSRPQKYSSAAEWGFLRWSMFGDPSDVRLFHHRRSMEFKIELEVHELQHQGASKSAVAHELGMSRTTSRAWSPSSNLSRGAL